MKHLSKSNPAPAPDEAGISLPPLRGMFICPDFPEFLDADTSDHFGFELLVEIPDLKRTG